MVVRIRPPTCGLPVAILEFVVYRDPTGCLTAFYFSPFEVRDDSNPSGDGLPHLSRIKLGGAATAISPYYGKKFAPRSRWNHLLGQPLNITSSAHRSYFGSRLDGTAWSSHRYFYKDC